MFLAAAQPDVVRSLQKDQYYLAQLQDDCQELASNVLGRHSIRWKAEVEFLSNFAYFGLTTLCGKPTLGEEYCDILQTTSQGFLPSFSRRAALVILQTVIPYVYQKARKQGRQMALPRNISGFRAALYRSWNGFLQLVLNSDSAAAKLRSLHLALFYLFGRYLQISHRLAKVRYLFLRKMDMQRPGYQILGLLILIQLCTQSILYVRERYQTRKPGSLPAAPDLLSQPVDGKVDDLDSLDPIPNCTLCLSARRNVTATECGHLFCWSCISECCTAKAECPLCRHPTSLQNLVMLCHYR